MEPVRHIILRLCRVCGLQSFVETGTLSGGTARWAAGCFPHVVTIEKFRRHFDVAVAACGSPCNVGVGPGDSRDVLPRVLQGLTALPLVWLDGHWSGGTAGEGDECPLLSELASVCAAPAWHIVLIDDARLFLAPPPSPHSDDQWPRMLSILQAFRRSRHCYDAVVLQDVVVACPEVERARFTELMQQLATEAWCPRQGQTVTEVNP